MVDARPAVLVAEPTTALGVLAACAATGAVPPPTRRPPAGSNRPRVAVNLVRTAGPPQFRVPGRHRNVAALLDPSDRRSAAEQQLACSRQEVTWVGGMSLHWLRAVLPATARPAAAPDQSPQQAAACRHWQRRPSPNRRSGSRPSPSSFLDRSRWARCTRMFVSPTMVCISS